MTTLVLKSNPKKKYSFLGYTIYSGAARSFILLADMSGELIEVSQEEYDLYRVLK